MNKNNLIGMPVPAIILLLLCANPATAQPYDIYASAGIGYTDLKKARTNDASEPDFTIDVAYDNSINFSGAIGLAAGNFRSELEITHNKHDLEGNEDSVTLTTVDTTTIETSLSGDISLLSGMVNAYYDFDTGYERFRPFVTAGIGFSRASLDIDLAASYSVNNVEQASLEVTGNDKDTGLTFQLGAGIGIPLSDNVTFDIRYRFLTSPNLTFFETVETETKTHNVNAGIRILF